MQNGAKCSLRFAANWRGALFDKLYWLVGVSTWSYTSVGHGEASELGKKSLTANISVNMNPRAHLNSFLESLNHVVFNDVVVKLLSWFFHLQIGHFILSFFTSCENADLKISIFTFLMIQRFFNIDYYWLISAMVERIKIVVNSQSLLNIVFCHVLEYKFYNFLVLFIEQNKAYSTRSTIKITNIQT